MRGRKTVLVCGMLLAAVLSCPAEVDSLEKLVSEWVELRRHIALEKRDWAEKQEQWTREIQLLESEKTVLAKRVADVGDVTSSGAKKRAELLVRKEKLQKVLSDISPSLDRAEADLKKWSTRIPSSLATEVNKLIAQIPKTHEEARRAPATRRLQVLVALLTQIETLQHNIHVTRELLPTEGGQRREVDVMYLGLGRAFAVSADSSWAAMGVPGETGWTWTPRPELAAETRKAVRVFNRHTPAELVTLPLKVEETKP